MNLKETFGKLKKSGEVTLVVLVNSLTSAWMEENQLLLFFGEGGDNNPIFPPLFGPI